MARTASFQRTLRMGFFVVEFALAVPIAIPFILLGWIAIAAGRYADTSIVVAHIPFFLGEHVRYLYYRATLRHVGRRVVFKYGSFCQQSASSIGSRVTIGFYNALGLVEIGDDVAMGGFVNVTSGRHQHGIDDPTRAIYLQPGRAELVRIGPDAWIGSNTVISASVGRRCVVGSGSTVVKDLPDHGVYAGSPARLIRTLE